jgi:hypothetical protein
MPAGKNETCYIKGKYIKGEEKGREKKEKREINKKMNTFLLSFSIITTY